MKKSTKVILYVLAFVLLAAAVFGTTAFFRRWRVPQDCRIVYSGDAEYLLSRPTHAREGEEVELRVRKEGVASVTVTLGGEPLPPEEERGEYVFRFVMPAPKAEIRVDAVSSVLSYKLTVTDEEGILDCEPVSFRPAGSTVFLKTKVVPDNKEPVLWIGTRRLKGTKSGICYTFSFLMPAEDTLVRTEYMVSDVNRPEGALRLDFLGQTDLLEDPSSVYALPGEIVRKKMTVPPPEENVGEFWAFLSDGNAHGSYYYDDGALWWGIQMPEHDTSFTIRRTSSIRVPLFFRIPVSDPFGYLDLSALRVQNTVLGERAVSPDENGLVPLLRGETLLLPARGSEPLYLLSCDYTPSVTRGENGLVYSVQPENAFPIEVIPRTDGGAGQDSYELRLGENVRPAEPLPPSFRPGDPVTVHCEAREGFLLRGVFTADDGASDFALAAVLGDGLTYDFTFLMPECGGTFEVVSSLLPASAGSESPSLLEGDEKEKYARLFHDRYLPAVPFDPEEYSVVLRASRQFLRAEDLKYGIDVITPKVQTVAFLLTFAYHGSAPLPDLPVCYERGVGPMGVPCRIGYPGGVPLFCVLDGELLTLGEAASALYGESEFLDVSPFLSSSLPEFFLLLPYLLRPYDPGTIPSPAADDLPAGEWKVTVSRTDGSVLFTLVLPNGKKLSPLPLGKLRGVLDAFPDVSLTAEGAEFEKYGGDPSKLLDSWLGRTNVLALDPSLITHVLP